MSKRLLSGKGDFFIDIASSNFRTCASERGLTTKKGLPCATKISEKTGIDRRTISDLLKGIDRAYNQDTIERLETALDVPKGYFAGLHGFDTHEKMRTYDQQQRFMREQQDQMLKEQRREDQLNTLLLYFGYSHRVDSNGVHELIAAKTKVSTFFNDDQFRSLIDDIGDRLAFECFKKSRP